MIDRLLEKIIKFENPTVVGLDPTYVMIPDMIKKEMLETYGKTPKAAAEMFIKFNKGIIDGICDIAPAVKPQIAMYEQYGLEGLRAYLETIDYAKKKGLIIIGDIKRGDIASTAAAYAGHIAGISIEDEYFDLWKEDAVTLNPYLGFDGIEPFIKPCKELDKGLFILVKTSNPSSGELQDLKVENLDKTFYEQTADLVSKWGELAMGKKGYSKIGAVVGATYKEQGEDLRKRLPHTFFLVPGYGAQGGKGKDLKGFFDKDGLGCIINSSRGIIAAYKKDSRYNEMNFADAARESAKEMKIDLQGAI
ncbi:orotidine-5'-phosphate decarboxylase [Anaerovorax odorimutans]|uniref:orotidine-5'-phosphate decarboxylase n=1 Tax=Anaerovorax odorimutans TaxID=109327 RepID=UPI0004018586|nr:orotidine-5'-phosphate decarboxylase [Anaerovorax odorimutans]